MALEATSAQGRESSALAQKPVCNAAVTKGWSCRRQHVSGRCSSSRVRSCIRPLSGEADLFDRIVGCLPPHYSHSVEVAKKSQFSADAAQGLSTKTEYHLLPHSPSPQQDYCCPAAVGRYRGPASVAPIFPELHGCLSREIGRTWGPPCGSLLLRAYPSRSHALHAIQAHAKCNRAK